MNIGLDLWFILGFHWGVAGAAIATIVSQYLAAVLSFIVLLRYIRKDCRQDPSDEHVVKVFDWKTLTGIARVAIPTMITQTILSVGIVVMQALVNSFGPSVMSGFTAASKIDGIAMVPMVQIGNAVSTFAAQNMGAGQQDRVVKGYHTALAMTAVVSITLAIVMFIWCKPIVGLFMDASTSAEAIAVGEDYVKIVCVFYIIMGFMNNTCGVLRGTGDIMPTMVSLLGNFGIRIAFAYIMTALIHDPVFIWWAQPLGWFVGFLIAYIRFKSGKWRTKRVI